MVERQAGGWRRRGLLALMAVVGTSAGSVGWRGDGSGRFPGAAPPASWSAEEHVVWRAAMPGPSNASPVVAGGLVCVLAEPSAILCVDARTGAVRWRANNEVVDALPDAQAAPLRPRIAKVDEHRRALQDMQAEYSRIRREARGGTDVYARLEAITKELAAIRAELVALGDYIGADADPWMGWTSATPVTDGRHLYALFGTGVVSGYRLDGTRLWTRWLGPDFGDLEAYRGAPGTSPVLAGGVLVVGYKDVLGLDPATGATLWNAGPHREYGNFAVADVGGTAVVITPAGLALRASDGKVLARDLGHTFFAGPVVQGDLLLFAGSTSFADGKNPWEGAARAWRLVPKAGGVEVVKLWEKAIDVKDQFYASPLLDGDRIFVVGVDGRGVSLSSRTGEVLASVELKPPVASEIWASPMSAGGAWWVPYVDGQLVKLDPATLKTLAVVRNEKGLAGHLFAGEWVYVRGAGSLTAVRAAR